MRKMSPAGEITSGVMLYCASQLVTAWTPSCGGATKDSTYIDDSSALSLANTREQTYLGLRQALAIIGARRVTNIQKGIDEAGLVGRVESQDHGHARGVVQQAVKKIPSKSTMGLFPGNLDRPAQRKRKKRKSEQARCNHIDSMNETKRKRPAQGTGGVRQRSMHWLYMPAISWSRRNGTRVKEGNQWLPFISASWASV